jgi:hypothetical protein
MDDTCDIAFFLLGDTITFNLRPQWGHVTKISITTAASSDTAVSVMANFSPHSMQMNSQSERRRIRALCSKQCSHPQRNWASDIEGLFRWLAASAIFSNDVLAFMVLLFE